MFAYAKGIVERAENIAASGGVSEVLPILRQLPIDDFGQLFLNMPNSGLPGLSKLLPRMADLQVQRDWTGADGYRLLSQTLAFVRSISQNYAIITKKDLSGCRILDFGCGYGRIIRAMYYFADPDDLYGCDPWDVSIELCKQDGVIGNLAVSEYLPKELPFSSKFDLIYAFSVFTHLSKRATHECLNTIVDALSPEGVIVITIRPVEYWAADSHTTATQKADLVRQHDAAGFAFNPHNRAAVDGDVTYGDTSMTLDYLAREFPRLRIVKIDRTFDDPYQILVFARLA